MITIYRNENVGSALQAYALQQVLLKKDFFVVFYKNIAKSHTVLQLIKRIVGAIISLRIKLIPLRLYRYYQFSKMHILFPEVSPEKLHELDIDYFVIGSDVVWDLTVTRPQFYWGIGLPIINRQIISYAASAANTTAELLTQNGITYGSLSHIQSISVRDQHTKDIIQPLVNIPISLACDPTLLLDADDFSVFLSPTPKTSNHILLYLYDRLSIQVQEEIQEFAKVTSRKIITFSSTWIPWADTIIALEPWNFITYYKNADFIVTDTFHGNVFSIIFKKQFVSIQRGKAKVNDLLDRLRLSHRLLKDEKGLISVLKQPIDWIEPDRELSYFRKQSFEYLYSALAHE